MMQLRSMVSRRGLLFLLAAFLLGGCSSHVQGYLDFWGAQRELKAAFEEEPSGAVLRELQPQDSYLLVGKLTVDTPPTRPVLVLAVSDRYKQGEVVATATIQTPVDHYQAFLPEGEYRLYFFSDLNGNGFHEREELVGSSDGVPITVSAATVKDGLTVLGPSLKVSLKNPTTSPFPLKVAAREQGYLFASLDDEFFDKKYGPVSLYDPKALMAHTQRMFFSLEKFDPKKTTVIFVHGVGGTPQDFKYLVEGLDRDRYQPWFFYYPSGLPLRKLSSYLADALTYAAKNPEFGLRKVVIVAHSMGGLVSLTAIEQLSEKETPPWLKGYVSFNSPYGGVASAQSALDSAPAVVAAWRDVVPGSAFLGEMYAKTAARKVPFYLFFGYTAKEGSDGTIALSSQLAPQVHLTATKSYGFEATHVSILNDAAVRTLFNQTIETLNR